MTLRFVVAAPFKGRGQDRIRESEFVVASSLDRDWLSPAQASRVVEVGVDRGLLSREGDDLVAEFDPEGVDIPRDFSPDEELFRERSAFEEVVAVLMESGMDKREAVAGINKLQATLELSIGAAAVVYAARRGVDVSEAAGKAREQLIGR